MESGSLMRRRQVATALSCFWVFGLSGDTFALHLFQLNGATLGRHVHVTCQVLRTPVPQFPSGLVLFFVPRPPDHPTTRPPVECQPFRQYLLTSSLLRAVPADDDDDYDSDADSDSPTGTGKWNCSADQEAHQSKSLIFIKFDGVCWRPTHRSNAVRKINYWAGMAWVLL